MRPALERYGRVRDVDTGHDDAIEAMAQSSPGKTVCSQNDDLDEMRRPRDACPHYSELVNDEFAPVTFLEDRGERDETAIAGASADLAAGYTDRRN